MATGLFSIPAANLAGHLFILGTTGKGRSRLLEAEAARLGLSIDEYERKMAPENARQARLREQERARRERAEQERLGRVCEAYWSATGPLSEDLSSLHDVLVCELGIACPTPAQQKALFLLLPASVVGQGIAWGFSDTAVRDEICEFVRGLSADARQSLMGV